MRRTCLRADDRKARVLDHRAHERRGIAKQLLDALLARAAALECTEAWVLRSAENFEARKLY